MKTQHIKIVLREQKVKSFKASTGKLIGREFHSGATTETASYSFYC